ncbi:MAG: hypothetical protein JO353_08120, partial [Phycisphaerae bacterium]|nr:hypothetical protein [Phycisphaerae bacterium]
MRFSAGLFIIASVTASALFGCGGHGDVSANSAPTVQQFVATRTTGSIDRASQTLASDLSPTP